MGFWLRLPSALPSVSDDGKCRSSYLHNIVWFHLRSKSLLQCDGHDDRAEIHHMSARPRMCGVRDSALLAKKHAHELKMSVYRFLANYGTLTWLFAPHCVPGIEKSSNTQLGESYLLGFHWDWWPGFHHEPSCI